MGRFRIRNPRTGEVDYEFDAMTAAELESVVRSMRESSAVWRERGVQSRIEVLQKWKRCLEKYKPDIRLALSNDTGRGLISEIEVDGVLTAIDRWSREAPALLLEPTESPTSHPSVAVKTQRTPYELAGIIGPWNFPMFLPFMDAIPALAAGCSVIIKPSERTPRFLEAVEATLADAPELQPHLRLIRGGAETGVELIQQVDLICFTGSVENGRKVAVAAAERLIPACLELGGKDPAIVLETADLELAARAIFRASIANAGQSCQSIERIYVHCSRRDDLVHGLVELAREVDFNVPDDARGCLGPMISEPQTTVILEQLADALEKGASLRYGGTAETGYGGVWIPPTIVTGVHHGMKLMTEETLGPILPVMAFDSIDEAVTLANDSLYGLSAAVFAGTLAEAESVARRLQVGAVSLNDAGLTSFLHESEKNSFKTSGLGASRMGPMGLLRFLRKKSLLFQSAAPLGVEVLNEDRAVFRQAECSPDDGFLQ